MKTNAKMYKMFLNDTTVEEQFQWLLYMNRANAPSMIVNKKVYENIGYYNEKYPFLEDYPFNIKITKAGVKIFLLEIYGVKYRIHSDSVQKTNQRRVFWSKYQESHYYLSMDLLENYPYFERIIRRTTLKLEYSYFKLLKNKTNKFATLIFLILHRPPYFIFNKIKKKNSKSSLV